MDMVRHLLKTRWDFIPLDDARNEWADHRARNGLSANGKVPLLSPPEANTKMDKTLHAVAIVIYGLALASSDLSGWNVCRFATRLCRLGCLSYAGQNIMPYQRKAQIVKTTFLAEHPGAFFTLLFFEIDKLQRKYGRALRIRLNMLSDITWEVVCPELFERFPTVRFYDYTKYDTYNTKSARTLPPNYELTYSASELTDDARIADMVDEGKRVAVVLSVKKSQELPTTYAGMSAVDGDASDDRYLDASGVIALRAKGLMRKPEFAGFVKEAVFA